MYFSFDTLEGTADRVAALARGPDDWVSVFLGTEHSPGSEALIDALNRRELNFFGAIVPGLIHGSSWSRSGLVVNRWRMVESPRFVTLDEHGLDWDLPLPDLDPETAGHVTVMVLVDFWSRQVSDLLDELFDQYGDTVNYIGAGCGQGQRRSTPCVLNSEGCHERAAVVAFLDSTSNISLRHGWRRISEPLVATRTSGNVIQEFNWEPALQIYQSVVGKDVANSLRDTYRPEAKRYPFGIFREDEEDVVRDPVAIDELGSLVCLSDVPENSVLHVLHGEPDGLIDAARQAASECFDDPGRSGEQSLVFDCFSRALLLDEAFERELDAINQAMSAAQPGLVSTGVLAMGEIASDGVRQPEFHNKTVVVSRFHD